jgi:hypothetical protein
MQKLISLFILTVILAACGGGDDPETTIDPDATPEIIPVSAAGPQVLFNVQETGDFFVLVAGAARAENGFNVTAASGGITAITIVIDTPDTITTGKFNLLTGEQGTRITIPGADDNPITCFIPADAAPTIDVVDITDGVFDAEFSFVATECTTDDTLTVSGTLTQITVG